MTKIRTVHGSISSVKCMCASHVLVYYEREGREKRTMVRREERSKEEPVRTVALGNVRENINYVKDPLRE